MNVEIQSVKFDADHKLVDFIQRKVAKLDKFAERAVAANVTLRIDKDNEKGNKVATLTLKMPGEDLVAESRSKTFEESVDTAVDAVKRQIEKYKEKFAK